MLHPNIASIYRLKMAHLARTLEKLARGVDGGAMMSHARRLCGRRPASGVRIVSGPHGATEWEVMAFLAHRERGEPLHGGCKPGQTHKLGHGEAGGRNLMKYNGNMERVVTPTGIEPVSPP